MVDFTQPESLQFVEEFLHEIRAFAVKQPIMLRKNLVGIGYEMKEVNFRFETPFINEKGGFHLITNALDNRVELWNKALEDAGVTTSEVDYLNAHGTSTPLGDLAEIVAVQSLFGQDAYRINISSTKSMTGHLLGATAAIEALACVLAITKGVVPPTINVQQLDPQIDPKLNLTLGTAQKREVKVAMSNTFGFGGHNSTIVFRKL